MTKQNAATTSNSRINALSMNDWCKVVAGMASELTAKQAAVLIRKMAARMAAKWGKDEGKLTAHIVHLHQEAA